MPITNTDLFLVNRAGTNYQATGADLSTFLGGGGGIIGSDSQSAAAAPTFRSDGTSALVEGDLWFDTTNDLLKGWNGTAWITIGPSAGAAGADVQAAAAAPTFRADGTSALVEGDLYYNTTDDTVYAWDGAAWVSTKANAVLKDSNLATGAALIPGGNDAARPGIPATGMLRYNDQGGTPVKVEYYDGAAWTGLATGGGGGGWVLLATVDGGSAATVTFDLTALTRYENYVVTLNNVGSISGGSTTNLEVEQPGAVSPTWSGVSAFSSSSTSSWSVTGTNSATGPIALTGAQTGTSSHGGVVYFYNASSAGKTTAYSQTSGSSGADVQTRLVTVQYASGTLDKVSFKMGVGNFTTGSTFSIYGITQ